MSAYGYVIVIKRDGEDGTRYPITKDSGFTVGSGVNSDIRILNEAIDQSHCQIIPSDVSRPILKHIGSYGQTLLNGTDIGSAEISLHHGDIIGIKERSFRWEYIPNSRFYVDYKSYKLGSTPIVASPQKPFRKGLKSPAATVTSASPGTPRPIAFVSPHMRPIKQEPQAPEEAVLSQVKAEPQQPNVRTPGQKTPTNNSGKKFVAVHHTCSAEKHAPGCTPKNTPGRGKVAFIASPQLSVQQPRPAVKNTPVRIVRTFTGNTSNINVRVSPVVMSASGRKLPIVIRTPQNIPLGSRSTIKKSKLRSPSVVMNYSLVTAPEQSFELRRNTSSETKLHELSKAALSPSRTSNVTLRRSVPMKVIDLRSSSAKNVGSSTKNMGKTTGQKLKTPFSNKKTLRSVGRKSISKTPLPKTVTTKRKLDMGMEEKAEKAARDLKGRSPKTPDKKKIASILQCYKKMSPMKVVNVQSVAQPQSARKHYQGVMNLPVLSSSTGKKVGYFSKIPVKVSIAQRRLPTKSPAAKPLSTAVHKVDVKTLVSPENVQIVKAADISPKIRASMIKRNLSDSFSGDISDDIHAADLANNTSFQKRTSSARNSLVSPSSDVLSSPKIVGSVSYTPDNTGAKRRKSARNTLSPSVIKSATPAEKKIRISEQASASCIPEIQFSSPPKDIIKFKTPTSILKSSNRGSLASSGIKSIKFDTPIENFFNDTTNVDSSRKSVKKSFPTPQVSSSQFGALDTLRTLPLAHPSVSSPQEAASSLKTTRRSSLKLLDTSGVSSFVDSPFGSTRASQSSSNTPYKSVLVGSAKRKSRYSSLHSTPNFKSAGLDDSVTSYGSIKTPDTSRKSNRTSLGQSGLSPLSESQEGASNTNYKSFDSPQTGERTFGSRSFTRSIGSPGFENSSCNSDSFSESFHNSECQSVNSTKFDFDSRQTPSIPQEVFVSPISDASHSESPRKTPSRKSSRHSQTKTAITPRSSRLSSKNDSVKSTRTPGSAKTATASEGVNNISPSGSRRSSLFSSVALEDTNLFEATLDTSEGPRKTRSSQNLSSLELSKSFSNKRKKSGALNTSIVNVSQRESTGADSNRSISMVSPSPKKRVSGVIQGVQKMKMSPVPKTPERYSSTKVSPNLHSQKSSPSSAKRSSVAVNESSLAKTPRASHVSTPEGNDEVSVRRTRSISTPANVTSEKKRKSISSSINDLNNSSKTPRSSARRSVKTPRSSVKTPASKSRISDASYLNVTRRTKTLETPEPSAVEVSPEKYNRYSIYSPSNKTEVFDLSTSVSFATPSSSVGSPDKTFDKSVQLKFDNDNQSSTKKTLRSSIITGLTPARLQQSNSTRVTPKSSVKSTGKSSVKSLKFRSPGGETGSEEELEQSYRRMSKSINFITFSPEGSRRSKSLHFEDSSIGSIEMGNTSRMSRSSVENLSLVPGDESTTSISFLSPMCNDSDGSSRISRSFVDARTPNKSPQVRSPISKNVSFSNVTSVSHLSAESFQEDSLKSSESLSRDMSARLSGYTSRLSVTETAEASGRESSGKRLSKVESRETKTPEGRGSIQSEKKIVARVDTPRPRGSVQLMSSPELFMKTPTLRRVTIGGESHLTPRSRKTPIPLSQKSKSILKTPKSTGPARPPTSGVKARKSLRMSMAHQLNDILENSELKTPSPQSNVSGILESSEKVVKKSARKSSARPEDTVLPEKSPRRSRSQLDVSYRVSTPLTAGRSRSFMINDVSRTSLMDISITSPNRDSSGDITSSKLLENSSRIKTPRTTVSPRVSSGNKETSNNLKFKGQRTARKSMPVIKSTSKLAVSRRSLPQGILKATPRKSVQVTSQSTSNISITKKSLSSKKNSSKTEKVVRTSLSSKILPKGVESVKVSGRKSFPLLSSRKFGKTPRRSLAPSKQTAKSSRTSKSARKSSFSPLDLSISVNKSLTPKSASKLKTPKTSSSRKSMITMKVATSGRKAPAKTPQLSARKSSVGSLTHSADKRKSKTPKSPLKSKTPSSARKSVISTKVIRSGHKTPKRGISPKNVLSDFKGVKKLMKTPKTQKSPKNDLSDVRGVKKLLKTPKAQKSPRNDLSNVSGVKKLLKTPKVQKSPKNDLSDVRGVKKLLKTPKVQKSPKNDLSDVKGVKKLLKTPKAQKSPKNDLSDVKGVKRLLQTPRAQKSPKNDLSDVRGVKRLMRSPKLKRSPANDLSNLKGVKKLMSTPKVQKSPKNDLTNVKGVRYLGQTPRAGTSPKNDLTNVAGVKKLMKSPKVLGSPVYEGVSSLFVSPKSKVGSSPKVNEKQPDKRVKRGRGKAVKANASPVQSVIKDDSPAVTQPRKRSRKNDVLPLQNTPSPKRSGKRKINVETVEMESTKPTAKEVKEAVKRTRTKKVEVSEDTELVDETHVKTSRSTRGNRKGATEISVPSTSRGKTQNKDKTIEVDVQNVAQQKKVQFASVIRESKSITPKGTRSKRQKVEKEPVTSAPRKSLLKNKEPDIPEQNEENIQAGKSSRKRKEVTASQDLVQSEGPTKRSRKKGQSTQSKVEMVPAVVEEIKQTTPKKKTTRSKKASVVSSPKAPTPEKSAVSKTQKSPEVSTPEKQKAKRTRRGTVKPTTPSKKPASRSRKQPTKTSTAVENVSEISKSPMIASPDKPTPVKVVVSKAKKSSPKGSKAVSRSRKQTAVSEESPVKSDSPKAVTPKKRAATRSKKESPKEVTPKAAKEKPQKGAKTQTVEKVVSTKAKRVSFTPAATRRGRKSVLYEKPSDPSRKSRSPIKSRLRSRK